MQVLPSGLVVPPLPYAVALVVGTVAVVGALVRLGPPVTDRVVLAATPWMVLGGGAHGFAQLGLVPGWALPLATAPAVYVTTFVIAGAVWATAAARTESDPDPTRALGAVGGAVLVGFVAVAYAAALGRGAGIALAWPPVSVAGAALVTAPVYFLLERERPTAVERIGVGGVVVVFAHALDGVSTAVGVDLLGTGERSPIPERIMAFAGRLPTADLLGTGWLFVLVKLAVAAAIVVLLADYVAEEPVEGNLLVVLVAAVGTGPAANNLTLFLVGGATP